MCKILVVEDEVIVAENLKQMLQGACHNAVLVGVVDDGTAAIELAKDTLPDIIIMDITLRGDLNGVQTAVLIQTQLAPGTISIIFTSAHAIEDYAPSDTLRGYKCVKKPYSDQDILDAIQQFCP
jgi:CheY-like chemotaxis protein